MTTPKWTPYTLGQPRAFQCGGSGARTRTAFRLPAWKAGASANFAIRSVIYRALGALVRNLHRSDHGVAMTKCTFCGSVRFPMDSGWFAVVDLGHFVQVCCPADSYRWRTFSGAQVGEEIPAPRVEPGLNSLGDDRAHVPFALKSGPL